MALAYVVAGVNHFANTAFYLNIMPPYLPSPYFLVMASGIAEIVLGIGLVVPRTSRAAAWGLIALLVAVSPANLHMAMHPELYQDIPTELLWIRLPLQLLLVLWAFWYTRLNEPEPAI